MIDSGLPQTFWGEAVMTAEYLHNLTPTKNKTPMELWNGKKPSVRHLKSFGCLAYYKIDNNKRHKLDPKRKRGIFVGYSKQRKAYRVYDPDDKKIYETSDVIFDEESKGYITKDTRNDQNCFDIDCFLENETIVVGDEQDNEAIIVSKNDDDTFINQEHDFNETNNDNDEVEGISEKDPKEVEERHQSIAITRSI